MISQFALILGLAFSSRAAVLSRTMGAVEDEVFTSRQVLLSTLVDRVSAGKDAPATAELDANGRDLATLLLEASVAREAENFSVEAVNNSQRDALAAKARSAINASPTWKRLEYSDEEIKKMISRKLAAKSLIRLRSETLKGAVTDAEAQAYFDKNRVKFGQLPFANFKESIKKYLAEQQLEERLRSWFDIVRRKHRAREFKEDAITPTPPPAPFGAPAKPTESVPTTAEPAASSPATSGADALPSRTQAPSIPGQREEAPQPAPAGEGK